MLSCMACRGHSWCLLIVWLTRCIYIYLADDSQLSVFLSAIKQVFSGQWTWLVVAISLNLFHVQLSNVGHLRQQWRRRSTRFPLPILRIGREVPITKIIIIFIITFKKCFLDVWCISICCVAWITLPVCLFWWNDAVEPGFGCQCCHKMKLMICLFLH